MNAQQLMAGVLQIGPRRSPHPDPETTFEHCINHPDCATNQETFDSGVAIVRDAPKIASMCVPVTAVDRAKRELAGSGTRVCAVVNYPPTDESVDRKLDKVLEAMEEGADDVEVFLSPNNVRSAPHLVREEIDRLAHGAIA
ncbi:hypothetical protein OQA88_1470 [Cercophora sp. LCS_1]